jgi:hypothetical protein
VERQASRFREFSRNPLLQTIVDLKKRLGATLAPQKATDVVEMYESIMKLHNQCNLTSRFNLKVNTQDCAIFQIFPSGWWETYTLMGNCIRLQGRQQAINNVKNRIIEIERALDGENWKRANEGYQEMASTVRKRRCSYGVDA